MLDKNGVEIRVGDIVSSGIGEDHYRLDEDGGMVLLRIDGEFRQYGIDWRGWIRGSSLKFEVIRRADGSDPRKWSADKHSWDPVTGTCSACGMWARDYFVAGSPCPGVKRPSEATLPLQPSAPVFVDDTVKPQCASDGYHTFDARSQCCVYCQVHEVETYTVSLPATCKPKSPAHMAARGAAELYADFHRIVTETVAREAPKVKVVTDFRFRSRPEGDDVGMLWLQLGSFREEGFTILRGNDASYVADVLYLLGNLRDKADPLR